MSLAWPWGLLALAALPALVAIYWLRTRARRRAVSSLLLWRAEAPRPASGRRFERLEAPPLFWLEAAALLLLALAAAGPRLPTAEARRPLVVVLDDSLSMSAGGNESPAVRARASLAAEGSDARHAEVSIVLAGPRPQTLVAGVGLDAAVAALRDWRPGAPAADLDAAVAFARELGGPRARLLVLGDRPPAAVLEAAGVVWQALGEPRPNLAIVQAVRSGGEGEGTEALLVEVEAFTAAPVEAELRIADGIAQRLTLTPGSPQRIRAAVAAGREAEVTLAPLPGRAADPQPLDDRAIVLPEPHRPARVELRLADPVLRAAVERALAATGRVRFTTGISGDAPELLVHDGGGAAAPGAWDVEIESGAAAEAFVGPFVVDRRHPLSEGLSLDGVLWAAPAGGAAEAAGARRSQGGGEGRAVVAAGDVPLLTDEEAGPRRRVTLRLAFAASSLPRSPDWPILWWNLVEGRAADAPGPRRANLRFGDGVSFGLPSGLDEAVVRGPDGEARLPAVGGRARFEPPAAGRYEIRAGDATWPVAVHPFAAGESDLRGAASGRWGRWDDEAAAVSSWRALGWLPGLLALGLLVLHLALTTRARSRKAGETPALPARKAGETPALPARKAGETPALPA